MTTIAIVGAGAGLGREVARRFGRAGFAVALLSRNADRVEALASGLRDEELTARGYVADVRDPAALRHALARAASDLGPIEVLQYSPLPAKEFMRPVLETTAEDLVGPIEFSVYGAVTAARQVVPGMRALGRGSILFVNGASAVRPRDRVTGTSIAFAGESAYAQLLHDAVAAERIHVGQLVVPFGIDDGDPGHAGSAVAERLWSMHVDRGDFRVYAEPLEP